MSVEGVHIVRAGRGAMKTWYIYAWRGGPQVDKLQQVGRPKLTLAHLEKISELVAADRNLPTDTIAGVVAAFRKSDQWLGYEPGTQKTWGRALDAIEAKWPAVPMRVFSDVRMTPKIVAWRDDVAKSSPRTADIGVTVLDVMLAWARLRGLVTINAAADIPTVYRRKDRAPVVWLPHDRAAIAEHAGPALQDALDLAALTGLRVADLVALRWDEIGEFAIIRTASKKSRGKRYRVTMPIVPQLAALLDRLRTRPRRVGVDTVLVNSFGNKWSGDGLGSSFHDARGKANGGTGVWHVERHPDTGEEERTAKRLHDFRGTFATVLMTMPGKPLTDAEIADTLGWSETQVGDIRKRYVDDAAVVVALGRRIAKASSVKRPVKRRAK